MNVCVHSHHHKFSHLCTSVPTDVSAEFIWVYWLVVSPGHSNLSDQWKLCFVCGGCFSFSVKIDFRYKRFFVLFFTWSEHENNSPGWVSHVLKDENRLKTEDGQFVLHSLLVLVYNTHYCWNHKLMYLIGLPQWMWWKLPRKIGKNYLLLQACYHVVIHLLLKPLGWATIEEDTIFCWYY